MEAGEGGAKGGIHSLAGYNSFSIGLNFPGKYYSGDSSGCEGSERTSLEWKCSVCKVNDVLDVMSLQMIHYINIVTKDKWHHFKMALYIVRPEY